MVKATTASTIRGMTDSNGVNKKHAHRGAWSGSVMTLKRSCFEPRTVKQHGFALPQKFNLGEK